MEEIFLPEDGPTELGASISAADAEWAEQGARRADSLPGLVLRTGESRDESGAVESAVVWKKGQNWAGRKAHVRFFPEACDTECAAIACALAVTAERPSDASSASSPTHKPRSRG